MIRLFLTEKQFRRILQIEIQFELAKSGIQREGFAIANHKVGSTDDTVNWKEYWEKKHPSHHFPSEPHICPSCLIERKEFVGGHIISEGETYIYPVCKHCNSTYKKTKAESHFFYVKKEDMVHAPEG